MAENIRFAIEKEEKLQEEVLLKDKDFVVDLVSAACFLQTFCKMRIRDVFTVKLKRWVYRYAVAFEPCELIVGKSNKCVQINVTEY